MDGIIGINRGLCNGVHKVKKLRHSDATSHQTPPLPVDLNRIITLQLAANCRQCRHSMGHPPLPVFQLFLAVLQTPSFFSGTQCLTFCPNPN